MTIKISPYKKKNGDVILYFNRSNNCNCVLDFQGFKPYGKGVTEGQRNTYKAALGAIAANSVPFTGDLTNHTEPGFCAPQQFGEFTLVATDIGNIGGMHVSSDGFYVLYKDKIVKCGIWLDEAE